jgi:uncharacterized coiled-coil DUF342 family protein
MQVFRLFFVSICFVLSFAACTKKEEKKPQSTAGSEAQAVQTLSEDSSIDRSGAMGEGRDLANAPNDEDSESLEEARLAEEKAAAVRSRTGLEVDEEIIRQRIETYERDLMSFETKLKRFLEVNDRFRGEAPDYEREFGVFREAFEDERKKFKGMISRPLRGPTRLQWERQERQWADDWRSLIRSFNDLEALYDKQYQGLK